MAGHAHGDGVETGGGKFRDRAVRKAGQNQRQRPGPEGGREFFGSIIEARERARRGGVANMRDQRIERGSALGVVKTRDRRAVGGIGAEPINGLGRKRDEPARGQRARRMLRHGAGRSLDRFQHLRRRLRGHRSSHACGRSPTRVISPAFRLSVAQSGSAPRSGRGGRRFKSCHSDQLSPHLRIFGA